MSYNDKLYYNITYYEYIYIYIYIYTCNRGLPDSAAAGQPPGRPAHPLLRTAGGRSGVAE